MPALSVRTAALLGLFLVAGLPSLPAKAADPAVVAEVLRNAVSALVDASVAYGAATTTGDGVAISDLTATLPDGSTAAVPSIIVSGIADREAGGFTAARVEMGRGSITHDAYTVEWGSANFEDVVVPGAEEVASRPKIRPFRKVSLVDVTLSGAALAAPVAISTVSFETEEEITDAAPSNIRLRATGVRIPATLIGNSVLGVIANMLNYQEFIADVSLDGVYNTGANTAEIDALVVDIATVGKIDLTAQASDFSVRAITDSNQEVAKAARAAARLDSLSVRIDNAGFVERMLDMQAQMLGGTRDDVRAQIVDGALPFALSFVKNEAFRTDFRAAVATFLADPRSLTVVMRPADPLPLGQVVRTALHAPMALPDLLAPTVSANN